MFACMSAMSPYFALFVFDNPLQRAMNATDRLLDDLNSSDENLNVLLSTKALEAFVKSYAKHHLTISKDNIVERRNEYGKG